MNVSEPNYCRPNGHERETSDTLSLIAEVGELKGLVLSHEGHINWLYVILLVNIAIDILLVIFK